METTEKSVEVLNDLIQINNDRIAGFEHAANELEGNDGDLLAIFESKQRESRQYVQELTEVVNQKGGDPETGTSGSGTIHRTWLDVKATLTGHTRKSILSECERGEDAIKKTYRSALSDDNGLSATIKKLVARQQEGILASHDQIKALRDSQA